MNREAIQDAAKKAIEPNWKNKTLFLGDNLRIMRRMNSGLMDLIYLDPPFNSNRKYGQPIGDGGMREVFKDVWRETDLDQAEHALLAKDHPSLYHAITAAKATHGGAMFSYLIMMSSRLIEMRRLLKKTGSLYLHCDWHAGHYIKVELDKIFGYHNFRNEIVWCYKASNSPVKGMFRRKHDCILFYSKSKDVVFNDQFMPYDKDYAEKVYKHVDEKGRRYRKHSKRADGSERRLYLDEGKGTPVLSWWTDITGFGTATQSKERSGYATQKPQALLERIIQASSNEGDIVFDPFCGCATSLVAAEKLGRQWVGIDVSPQSAKEIKKRMIKLAIDREENELAIWQGIHNRDLRTAKQLDSLRRDEWGVLPHYRTHKNWLYGECGGICAGCGQHFQKRNLTIDHYVPKSKGGTDHRSNLQLLCGACNSMKGARPQAYLDDQLKKLGITLH